MIKCALIGGSGYTGSELVSLLAEHPQFDLTSIWVSRNSEYQNKSFASVFPKWSNHNDLQFKALETSELSAIARDNDAVFLCTDHKVSHDIASVLLEQNTNVFDLSGAFRLNDPALYSRYYGFTHEYPDLLALAEYGLVEWNAAGIKSSPLVAVPGCYPTAVSLALKPFLAAGLLNTALKPIVNAVSGISGAGRKPSMTNSFCELSYRPYGLFTHRHSPEIEQTLDCDVSFTPHIGDFDRGILATIHCYLDSRVDQEGIQQALTPFYQGSEVVKWVADVPQVADVKYTPRCHLYWQKSETSNECIMVSAIDNLLKGAASQALQCAVLKFNLDSVS